MPGAYPPQGPPAQGFGQQGQYFSPGEAGPRPYASPGDAMAMPQQPGGGYGPPPAAVKERGEHKSQNIIIVAVIITLVVVAGCAALYFTVLKGGATGPEATIQKYFAAISKGDTNTLKSLYAPANQPDPTVLALVGTLYSSGMIRYSDIELNTVSQTATDATVQLLDATVSASLLGQKMSEKLSATNTGGQKLLFTLKLQDGKWLITGDAGFTSPEGPALTPKTGTRLEWSSASL